MEILTAAKQLQVTPDQLRKWEREGLMPPVARRADGLRNYSAQDLAWVQHVKRLGSSEAGAAFLREYVHLVQLGPQATPARQSFVAETKQQWQAHCQTLLREFDTMEAMVVKQQGGKSDEH
ncbi:MerR family transcriptional regulator [Limosilactobacillus ingluviei]|uniref:MerR family transcriptional regulator n=1 Tax=Limosilactobacillus ingluviei TaxID=148604 RepID=UPI0002D8AE60|nr:MerR family transcriptional regulator [Limosilactobacillus ingluviei]